MTTVELTPSELEVATFVGERRQQIALAKARPDYHGFDGNGTSVHVDGSRAEMAVAKSIDRYWTPLADDLSEIQADVSSNVQVRSTARQNGSLIVHPEDPDEHLFYLAVCAPPVFRIFGSILGAQAKQPQWWRSDVRNPAYFVPQAVLA